MTDFLRIAGIIKESIVDGPGIRLVVFLKGVNTTVKDAIIRRLIPLPAAD